MSPGAVRTRVWRSSVVEDDRRASEPAAFTTSLLLIIGHCARLWAVFKRKGWL